MLIGLIPIEKGEPATWVRVGGEVPALMANTEMFARIDGKHRNVQGTGVADVQEGTRGVHGKQGGGRTDNGAGRDLIEPASGRNCKQGNVALDRICGEQKFF